MADSRQKKPGAKRGGLGDAGTAAPKSPMFGTVELGGVVYDCEDITMQSDVIADPLNSVRHRVRVVVGKAEDRGPASVARGRAAIEAVAGGEINTATLINIEKARTALSGDRGVIERTLALLEQADLVVRGRLRAERHLGLDGARLHGAVD